MMHFEIVGEILDTVFSLLGKTGRVFNNQGKKVCFLIWIVCLLYWFGRDLYLNLYSQAFFCLTSIGLHIHGYRTWTKKKIGKEK